MADPNRMASVEPNGQASLHEAVRAATAAVHTRLHRHTGLAAVAAGRICRADYQRLLLRLYGFYRPFERSAGLRPRRSEWLARDLAVLATPPGLLDAAGTCTTLPPLDSAAAVLGALYVVEGSALGGRALANSLRPLLGADSLAGRRFFASDGADTGKVWRAFLARLAAVPPTRRHIVIVSAAATFASFETWMAGWEASEHA